MCKNSICNTCVDNKGCPIALIQKLSVKIKIMICENDKKSDRIIVEAVEDLKCT